MLSIDSINLHFSLPSELFQSPFNLRFHKEVKFNSYRLCLRGMLNEKIHQQYSRYHSTFKYDFGMKKSSVNSEDDRYHEVEFDYFIHGGPGHDDKENYNLIDSYVDMNDAEKRHGKWPFNNMQFHHSRKNIEETSDAGWREMQGAMQTARRVAMKSL